MTTEAAFPGDDPHRLLSKARELTRRVRRDQRATWFPLIVFAALTFLAIPVRRYGGHHLTCLTTSSGQTCRAYSNADLVYWPLVLVLAYAAIVTFYIRRARARGLETRVRPYAVAGIVIAVVLSALAIFELRHPLPYAGLFGVSGLSYRLVSPGMAIGLALLVLAWAERNRSLLLVALAYLAVVLVPITFSRVQFDPPWYGYPVVSKGTLLLLAAIGFALAQRPLRSARSRPATPPTGSTTPSTSASASASSPSPTRRGGSSSRTYATTWN